MKVYQINEQDLNIIKQALGQMKVNAGWDLNDALAVGIAANNIGKLQPIDIPDPKESKDKK